MNEMYSDINEAISTRIINNNILDTEDNIYVQNWSYIGHINYGMWHIPIIVGDIISSSGDAWVKNDIRGRFLTHANLIILDAGLDGHRFFKILNHELVHAGQSTFGGFTQYVEDECNSINDIFPKDRECLDMIFDYSRFELNPAMPELFLGSIKLIEPKKLVIPSKVINSDIEVFSCKSIMVNGLSNGYLGYQDLCLYAYCDDLFPSQKTMVLFMAFCESRGLRFKYKLRHRYYNIIRSMHFATFSATDTARHTSYFSRVYKIDRPKYMLEGAIRLWEVEND